MLRNGPGEAPHDEVRLRAYSLSALVDDLSDTSPQAERFVLSTCAWNEAAELALLLNQHWLGKGKWLLRELAAAKDQFGLVGWARSEGDIEGLLRSCRAVLQAAGGYHQVGFIRGSRPPGL